MEARAQEEARKRMQVQERFQQLQENFQPFEFSVKPEKKRGKAKEIEEDKAEEGDDWLADYN